MLVFISSLDSKLYYGFILSCTCGNLMLILHMCTVYSRVMFVTVLVILFPSLFQGSVLGRYGEVVAPRGV